MNVPPKVSHQSIDGEVIVINLQTGAYYSLRDVAAPVWELLAGGVPLPAALDRVLAAYPDEPAVSGEVSGFARSLVAEGLLVEEAGGRLAENQTPFPGSWTPPRFEKFTDMKELLLLDPIHEVDASGWPHKPVGS